MKIKITIYLFILFHLSGCLPNNSESMATSGDQRIIGGEAVLSSDAIAKHVVLIHSWEMTSAYDEKPREVFLCTGVIIGKRSILTAAHCFEKKDKNKKNFMEVYFTQSGEDLNKVPKVMGIALDSHPFYKNTDELERHFDLMVVTLANPIPEGFEPATILPAEVELKINDVVIPTGFGKFSESGSDKNEKLNKSRGLKILEDFGTHFMVDQRNGSGICSGDSGGPTFFSHKSKFYLAGINQGAAPENPNQKDFCHYKAGIVKVQTHKSWILSKVKN